MYQYSIYSGQPVYEISKSVYLIIILSNNGFIASLTVTMANPVPAGVLNVLHGSNIYRFVF